MSAALINSEDPSYLEWIKRSVLYDQKTKLLKKDPFAADLQEAQSALENATLKLLRSKVGLEIDKVLRVERENPHPDFGPYIFYELDGLLRPKGNPMVFCEIKHSLSRSQSLKAARKQLRKRLIEGKQFCNESFGIAVCFQLSSIEDRPTGLNHISFDELITLFHQRQPPEEIISVSVQDTTLIKALEAEGFKGERLMSNLLKAKQLLDDPTLVVTNSDDDFSNSLGDAFDQL